jgi:hypothetical protein
MRVAERYGKEGRYGGARVGPEGRELSDSGGGEAADFGRWKAEERNQLGQGSGIGAAAEIEGELNCLVVEVSIHE